MNTTTQVSNETVAPIPSLNVLREAFKETSKLYPKVAMKIWGWLLFLHLLQLGATQVTTYAAEAMRASGREDIGIIAAIAGIDMIFNLVWSAFWVLVLSLAAAHLLAPEERDRLREPYNLPSTVNRILIEQTRVLGSILWRVPLVIWPVIQWVRLTLVPFIVIFDRCYEAGKVDAISRSKDLSHRHFWMLSSYLAVSAMLPWISDSLTQSDKLYFWQNPFLVLAGSVPTLLINIATGIFLFSIYRQLSIVGTPSLGSSSEIDGAKDADIQLDRR